MTIGSKEFIEIIAKALVDPVFRDLLYNDRPQALGGYQPTADETQFLDGITRQQMDGYANDLAQNPSPVLFIVFTAPQPPGP